MTKTNRPKKTKAAEEPKGTSTSPKKDEDEDKGETEESEKGKKKAELKVAKTPSSPALLTQMTHAKHYRRAKALGPGRTGSAIWVVQRYTALALVPLVLWFVTSMIWTMTTASRLDAAAWLGQPLNAALIALLIPVAMRHASIGLRIILEDYVHSEGLRLVCVLIVNSAAILLTLAALISLALLLTARIGGV